MTNSAQPSHSGSEGIHRAPIETRYQTRYPGDSSIDANIDTQYAQPLPERSDQRPGLKRRFTIAISALLAAGAIGGGAFALGRGSDEQRNPGVAIDSDTQTSALPTPGSESTASSPSTELTPNNIDVFELPPPPAAEESLGALANKETDPLTVDYLLSTELSSELTHKGPDSDFSRVFLGGEWVKHKSEGPFDTTPDDQRRPIYSYKDDGGLAARTHLAPLFDFVRQCEAENHNKRCGFIVELTRDYDNALDNNSQSLKLADLSGQIPNQDHVRVRATVNQEATLSVKGIDLKTGRLVEEATLITPIADIYYMGADGNYRHRWVPTPADTN